MEDLNWQNFLDKLTKICKLDGVLTKFKALSSDSNRLQFCLQHKLIETKLSQWMSKNPSERNHKDSRKALDLKAKGNRLYVQKQDENALKLYGDAILYATESELGLLYGNRSAALFKLGFWHECITDIDLAFDYNFPQDKIWKLYKRKGEALLKLIKLEESQTCFQKVIDLLEHNEKLVKERKEAQNLMENICSDGSNMSMHATTNEKKFIPVNGYSDVLTNGSKNLDLRFDELQGRHLVANENIKAGSVIVSEKPFAAVLLPPWYLTHCQHCFLKLKVTYPCRQCTNVCYCSEKCRLESWNAYHSLECAQLNLMEKIGIAHLALRIILATNFEELMNAASKQSADDFIPGCDVSGIYHSNYESVYHLLPHSEKMQVDDLFQYTVAAALLYKVLQKHNYFETLNDNEGIHIGGLIARHIQQLVCNAHAITCLCVTGENSADNKVIEQDQVRIATAIYPTVSLLNHSCEPTILNSFYKDNLIVKVTKDVKKGEQIYNCYGPHFRRMSYVDRQQALKQQYFFDCHCEHCVKEDSMVKTLDSYACKTCKSALQDMKCETCNFDFTQELQFYQNHCEHSLEMFNSGLQILQSQQNNESTSKALKLFLNCAAIQKNVLYKNHSAMSKTHDIIAKCYTRLHNYEEAVKFLTQSVSAVESRYNCTSIELTNEMLKLSDVYMELMQQYIDRIDYATIRKYLPDAIKTLERSISLVKLNRELDCDELQDLQLKYDGLMQLRFIPGIQ